MQMQKKRQTANDFGINNYNEASGMAWNKNDQNEWLDAE